MNQTASNTGSITQLLSEGKVAFTYTTTAGETRNAIGTTSESLLPESAKGTVFSQTGDNVTYWDMNSNGVRTFNLNNLDQSSIEVQ
jgi:hypothetical protein